MSDAIVDKNTLVNIDDYMNLNARKVIDNLQFGNKSELYDII